MADILFTHSYFYRFDPKQWKAQQPYPPYGTLFAAALMRELGYSVALYDTNLATGPEGLQTLLDKEQPRYLVIYDDGFNYLTKMCLTNMREAAFRMANMAKAMGCTVIVNSSDSTDHYQEYLDQGADFVLLGEGETTLKELIAVLESGESPSEQLSGIAWMPTGFDKAVRHAARPVLQDLDSLPDPAWDLVDMMAYRDIWLQSHGEWTLNLATTRGCPYKCNWCAKPIYGNRYNTRSPQRVATEIEMLIREYGVHHFWMADDIFGLKPRWVQDFRDIVRSKKLQFGYKIQSRVDLLLKEDTIDALAASGLKEVWVGAESGSQKILDAMDKGTKLEEIRVSTQLLQEKGIRVCFFLQFGYLGETREEVEATIRMVETLLPDDIGISVSYPLPGTKFFESVKGLLGDKHNWTDSDDLAMLYPATFPPAFYKRLHRLVHKRFRLRQGLVSLKHLLSGGKVHWKQLVRIPYYWPAVMVDTWKLRKLETPG
ncbi:MAG: B12-binding domain-containing radical SAM protein [Lewinellaceae bacterium]|nr:B12-binding domain-containing radical SAM protein [Lewinellaceae bacterium]